MPGTYGFSIGWVRGGGGVGRKGQGGNRLTRWFQHSPDTNMSSNRVSRLDIKHQNRGTLSG